MITESVFIFFTVSEQDSSTRASWAEFLSDSLSLIITSETRQVKVQYVLTSPTEESTIGRVSYDWSIYRGVSSVGQEYVKYSQMGELCPACSPIWLIESWYKLEGWSWETKINFITILLILSRLEYIRVTVYTKFCINYLKITMIKILITDTPLLSASLSTLYAVYTKDVYNIH